MGLFDSNTRKTVTSALSGLFKANVRRQDLMDQNAVEETRNSSDSEPEDTIEAEMVHVKESDNIKASNNEELASDENLAKGEANSDEDLEEKYFRDAILGTDNDASTAQESVSRKDKIHEQTESVEGQETTSGVGVVTKNGPAPKREVFVGNVPFDVITDKSVYREFKQLFSDAVAGTPDSDEPFKGKIIESLRFRSIAFSEPLPRRAAFIKRKLHPTRDAMNAYIAFGTTDLAKRALKLNGEVFHGHHIRVDSVASPSPIENKRCVFIGNLHFDAVEESIWQHFADCGSIESVRIIRDAKTNFGKGFAYVQFEQTTSVDLALSKNGSTLGGRDIRVTRAKSMVKQRRSLPLKSRPVSKIQKAPQSNSKPGAPVVLEGARAKEGDKAGLGRKRKARNANSQRAKRRAAVRKPKN